MTQATTDAQPHAMNPSQVMLHLNAALLAPMFLTVTGGDIALARAAAIQVINAYGSVNQAGVLAAAQVAAFGITAMGSLSLSMADLTLSMTLRLRGNANALNRSAEQNRRALKSFAGIPVRAEPEIPLTPEDLQKEAATIARVEAARQAVTEARTAPPIAAKPIAAKPIAAKSIAATPPPQPPIATKPIAPTPVARPAEASLEHRHRLMWANAISEVAGEFTASLTSLPPAERKIASHNAALLSTSVSDLLSEKSLPDLNRAIMAGKAG